MVLNRDQIMAAKTAVRTETVEIPEWGGTVIVRGFTGRDTDDMARLVKQAEDRKNTRFSIRPYIVQRGVFTEDGPMFLPEDIPWISEQPVTILNRIFEVMARLNGGENPEQAALGNSQARQLEDLNSDSL